MKHQYSIKQIKSAISYWTALLNESNSKAELSNRRIERNSPKIPDDDDFDTTENDELDTDKNPFERFSDELLDAGRRNGYENTWFISNTLMRQYSSNQADHKPTYPLTNIGKEIPLKKFINSCYVHVLSECHDVIYDTAVLIGPVFEIENIKGWAAGAYETYAAFFPNFNKSTITLASVNYGSYDGNLGDIIFPSKDSQRTLLNDIYRLFPYLEQYESSNPREIEFKIPRQMMQDIQDAFDRQEYAWKWSSDLRNKEQVKREQVDAMWRKRQNNVHLKNKDAEIEQMYRDKAELNESTTNTSPFFVKKIQDMLNKVISEEWIAGNLYRQMILGCSADNRSVIKSLFSTIASDELNDHMTSLIDWAIEHGYDVPSKISEFTKYAKADATQLEKFKTNQTADYYIAEALKSEQSAVESYTAALDIPEIVNFTDLQSLLWHIFYDEQEHITNLNSALIAYQASVNLNIY